MGLKDAQLKALGAEHTALEKRQIEDRRQLALAEQQRQAADAAWQRTASDPMLQAQAREIHGDKVARWEDAQQILARREAERRHAEELGEQLMAAQRLGAAFDRQRVPEAVRQVLADLDKRPRAIPALAAELVERLASNPAARQVLDQALAPQKQLIERELRRMAMQPERKQGKEWGGPER